MSKTMLTPQELSDRWRGAVAVKTLASWRHTGQGPKYLKIGGRVMYPLDQVEAYERERLYSGTMDYEEPSPDEQGVA